MFIFCFLFLLILIFQVNKMSLELFSCCASELTQLDTIQNIDTQFNQKTARVLNDTKKLTLIFNVGTNNGTSQNKGTCLFNSDQTEYRG